MPIPINWRQKRLAKFVENTAEVLTAEETRALADATLKQLNDEANRATLTEIFTEMHHALRQNTALRAAEAVAQVLETRRPR